MRKNTALLILLLFCSQPLVAQTFEWAHSGGTNTLITGSAVAIDGKGNTYAAGSFYGKANFGGKELLSQARDMYLVKYDPKGNLLWSQRGGGGSDDFANALVVDNAGNAYVTGSFTGKMPIGRDTLTSRGQGNTFVAKFAPDGAVVWAKSAGGFYGSYGMTLSLDKAGNTYIAGVFRDTMHFSESITFAGRFSGFSLFIAKYDPKGNLLWAKPAGGASYYTPNESLALTSTPDGTTYLTGYYQDQAAFDTVKLATRGTFGFFLAKYHTDGKLDWVRTSSGDGSMITGKAVAAGSKGNVYVTGTFTARGTFDTISVTNRNPGFTDVFLAKYNAAGRIVWLRTSSAFGAKTPYALATDDKDNAYLGGSFHDSAAFGSIMQTGSGAENYFLVKYNSKGDALWGRQGGRHGTSSVHALSVDKSGNIAVSGQFTDTLQLNTIRLKGADNTQDAFIAKISPRQSVKEKKLAAQPDADFHLVSCTFEKASRTALLKFSIAKPAFVTLSFYDELGQISESFIEEQRSPGVYEERLDLKDIPDGEYYCRLQAGMEKATKKIVVKK